jgi:mRNA interferase YafQ
MMLKRIHSTNFNRQLSKCIKRGLDISKLEDLVDMLLKEKEIPSKYKKHKMHGEFKGHYNCHIAFDWILLYKEEKDAIILTHIGTHSDLLK